MNIVVGSWPSDSQRVKVAFMRDTYHEQLDLLVARLQLMSRLVGDAMDRATVALSETDSGLAREVMSDGIRMNRLRAEMEEHAYTILALQSPVATDLRVVLAAVRATGDLDRMARLAVHVAEAVLRRHPQPVVPPVLIPRFVEMGRIAAWLAVMAGQVFESRDVAVARTFISVDDDMDDLYRTLFTVIGYQDWAYGTVTAVDVALLSRFYERFADHAVALAQETTFIVTGHAAWAGTAPNQDRVPTGARIA